VATGHVVGRKLRTVRRVVRRIRTDGRLPAESRRLATDALAVAAADRLARPVARALPVVGGGRRLGAGRGSGVARHGWRRWISVGVLDVSVDALRHEMATSLVSTWQAAGLAPFVVDASGAGLEIGLTVGERDSALAALQASPDGRSWYVEGTRGRRSRPVAATARWRTGWLRGCSSWRAYRLWQDADGHLVGAEAGPLITFWDNGPHDRLEQVAVRGLVRFPADSPTSVETVDGHDYPSRRSFAVDRALSRHLDPIDIVITWVDGDDASWRADKARWSGDATHTTQDAVDEARFRSRDELLYALRSISQYAGWCRRIHIVTADQAPGWLVEDDRLRLVSHSEIFPSEWLPTFNSHSIESRLHHIEGLAEHFVYFNDDMFLGRPTRPGLFFTPNGIPLFFPGQGRFGHAENTGALGVDAAARNGRALIEERWGRVVEHKLLHAPYAHRRSTLLDIEAMFPEEMERTGQSRFRADSDLSVASSFAQYVGYCTGRSLPGAIVSKYVNVENANLAQHLRQIRRRAVDTFCLNATEQALADDEGVDRAVGSFLESYFPTPSPWETRSRA
jgi:hypothetical protein